MEIPDLWQYAADYLRTLDDKEKDEWWGTPRNVEGGCVHRFISWVEKNSHEPQSRK